MHSIGYLFREGLKNIWKNRTMSIASIGVLISCLLITGVAAALTLNLSATMDSIEANNTITVYLEENTPALTSVKIGEELKQLDNISECIFVSKDDALVDIINDIDGDSENDGSIFDSFQGDDNPLPDAYTISMEDLSLYDQTIAAIQAVEGVDHTSDYSRVASMLDSLATLVQYGSIAIVVVLSVVSLFIISNTVKVTMFSRRVEINIMKAVGATNGFVRLPFIVESMTIGIISGLISATLLYFAYDKAVEAVYAFVSFLTIIDIQPYVLLIYIGYALAGMLFGILGGSISIRRYLKKEGENAIV